MKTSVLFVLAIFTLGVFTVNYAYAAPGIEISGYKTDINPSDSILIVGTAEGVTSYKRVNLSVYDPTGKLIYSPNLMVSGSGGFNYLIHPTLPSFAPGTYKVVASHPDLQQTSEFTFTVGGMVAAPTPAPKQPTKITLQHVITGGTLLDVMADEESKSLVLGVASTGDGQIIIDLPRDILDARLGGCTGDDDSLFVLVDGEEEMFEETKDSNMRKVTINFADGTEEIEIIGTCVVPEFGAIASVIMIIAIAGVIMISTKSKFGMSKL